MPLLKYFRNVGLECPPPAPENENLGRSWHFEFELVWRSYVETNRCIPRGYHLVSLVAQHPICFHDRNTQF